MHLIFEDAGKLNLGKILAQTPASAQVELPTGKRIKVKSTHQLMTLENAQAHALWDKAWVMANEFDLNLAWEFAPLDEFGFADVARDYYQDPPTELELVATLLGLHLGPHYFRRLGKGRFKKAAADLVQQALQAIARKEAQQAQVQTWAQALVAGECPTQIQEQLFRILFKPDKNALPYQAVVRATQLKQLPVLDVLKQAGAIASSYQFHWQRFLFDQFPQGTGFAQLEVPTAPPDLPRAMVQAYSIDDSHTTEIDDALSIQGLDTNTWTLGIHIAAPGCALTPGSAWDTVAKNRMSTVYMPGHKITMLPPELVQAFSLDENKEVPALSLYVSLDAQSLSVLSTETKLERLQVVRNLRHDQLDQIVTEQWLSQSPPEHSHDLPVRALQAWFRVAKHLKQQREIVRGKPENFNRPDPVFRLVDSPPEGPLGDELVVLSERQRGAPLDLIVAEAMILTNHTWGQWMADLGVPAIYRSQASLAPGIKVRMGTKPLPHAGMGVGCYAWSTSPLRRYADLVNQWQILACVQHGNTAALACPFKPKETDLLSIISAFDAAYSAYNAHQSSMERYWTLQYIRQQALELVPALIIKDLPGSPRLARLQGLPLVLEVHGADALKRGQRVLLRLVRWDDLLLSVSAEFVQLLDDSPEIQPLTDVADDYETPAANQGLQLALDASDDPGNSA